MCVTSSFDCRHVLCTRYKIFAACWTFRIFFIMWKKKTFYGNYHENSQTTRLIGENESFSSIKWNWKLRRERREKNFFLRRLPNYLIRHTGKNCLNCDLQKLFFVLLLDDSYSLKCDLSCIKNQLGDSNINIK